MKEKENLFPFFRGREKRQGEKTDEQQEGGRKKKKRGGEKGGRWATGVPCFLNPAVRRRKRKKKPAKREIRRQQRGKKKNQAAIEASRFPPSPERRGKKARLVDRG